MTFLLPDSCVKNASLSFETLSRTSREIQLVDTASDSHVYLPEHVASASSGYLRGMLEADKTQQKYLVLLPRPDAAKEVLMYLKTGMFSALSLGAENFIPVLINAHYLQLDKVIETLASLFRIEAKHIMESKSFKQGELPASLFMQLIPKEGGTGKFATKCYLTNTYSWVAFEKDTQRSVVPTMLATANGLQVLAAWFQSENPDSKSVQMMLVKALLELHTEEKNKVQSLEAKLLEAEVRNRGAEVHIAEMNARPPEVVTQRVIQKVKVPVCNGFLLMIIVILVVVMLMLLGLFASTPSRTNHYGL